MSAEIILSADHIDPYRDEGYLIIKIGEINAVEGGGRTASMICGNVKITEGSQTFVVHIKFEVVEAFTYTCPYALKFTAMIRQQTNAPTLSIALDTDMAQYDNLVITPDEIGLVTLTGIWL